MCTYSFVYPVNGMFNHSGTSMTIIESTYDESTNTDTMEIPSITNDESESTGISSSTDEPDDEGDGTGLKIPLRTLKYFISIYPKNSKYVNTINIYFTAKYCNRHRLGPNCIAANKFNSSRLSVRYRPTYSFLYVTVNMAYVRVRAVAREPEAQFLLQSRYSGDPGTAPDSVGHSDIEIFSPAPGTWYFSIELTSHDRTAVTLYINSIKCKKGKTGSMCEEDVILIDEPEKVPNLYAGAYSQQYNLTYFYVPVTRYQLYISAITESDLPNPPQIFASFQHFPYMDSEGNMVADIHGCTEEDCSKVSTINLNASCSDSKRHNDDFWFVALKPVDKNQKFALWTNTICPNNCNGKGECQAGICNCNKKYYGIDCSKNERFIERYLLVSILVLIAALILFGGIAWLHIKFKYPHPEEIEYVE
eukprot:TRINITY_DN3690_c0_g1_i3.p1 TRINITY_DN3690_c0_g1~~TRINITY_DN3690_c0_g1_i3.p1  ORF type:complete len:419 (+),score=70.63 TRINITY_DN3690_c0_g1_i3:322-1578(+)